MDGYQVDVAQLRAHARNIEAIKARFGAVKTASAHIAQDDSAYGVLCGWISGVLEGRHGKQDELIAYVEENLGLVVAALETNAIEYEAREDSNVSLLNSAGGAGPK